jgi:hypothetical protein
MVEADPLVLVVSGIRFSELTGPGDCKLDFQIGGSYIGQPE